MLGDAGAERRHPPDRLVPRHDRQARRRDPALRLIQVGVADAARLHPHQHLARSGLGHREPAQLQQRRIPAVLAERAGPYQDHRPHGRAAHADAPE